MRIFLELFYNFSILVSISIISGFIGYRGKWDWQRSLVQGVLFGSASVLGMLHPLVVAPGLIFDGRSVMISLAGFFYGPVTATVAASIALLVRIKQGGVGAVTGALVILSSALIGVVFFRYRNRLKEDRLRHGQLLFMGVIVHVTMILLMFTLPDDKGISTVKLMGLPVIIIYPLATVFIAQIIDGLNARRRTLVALQQSEATFRMLFEGSSDPILIIENDKYIDCNQATIKLLNYPSKESIIGKSPWDISAEVQPDGRHSKDKSTELFTAALKSKVKFEWWHQKQDGTVLPVEIMMTTIMLHNKQVFHVLWRDISERKQMELRLEYLSYHDQLTGLFNRRFFEEEVKRLDVERNYPLTMVLADVNGLKLINDTFGHYVGDELLKRVAEAIRKGCRADDIIARLGGDEFVIILPKVDSNETEQIVKRIKAEALKEPVGSLEVSISFGWESKLNKEQTIQEIFKKAEDRMYQKKLFEGPSIRGKTIKAILKTLHEKNKREEQHSHRVSAICRGIGEAVGLSEGALEELETVGLLHDIGKIAIEEKILNKPGKLTAEEWAEIKRHPEIGCRILSSVNDMAQIAEYVLAHHERWDGKGYPKGLKREAIPIQARIIAIADAYDAMTSVRSYRAALSKTVAIGELAQNAGTQFDAELVRIFIEKLLKVEN